MTIQYVSSQIIFLDGFATLEEQDTIQNVERVRSALAVDLENLDNYVHDWAAWDDTHAFVQDTNDAYIESNLVDQTFINSQVNFMVFLNSSGAIVFSKGFDVETEEEMPFPESLLEHLTADSLLLQHNDTYSYLRGLLSLPENPMLFASRPIINSNYEGPIVGTLVMGYYLDSNKVDSLAETTHLSFDVQRVDDSLMDAEFQEAFQSLTEETPVFVNPLNSDSVAGYTIVEDVYGEPCLILSVVLPRTIYAQGQTSIFYFILLRIATGLTASILILFVLEKLVLSRLAQIGAEVNKIKSRGDPSERLSISGNDEIADLGNELNRMLTSLEHSQSKLRMLNEKLGVVGSLTRHDVRNKLSIIASNVYLAKQKLADDPDTLEFLASIESTIDKLEKIFEFSRIYEKVGVEELVYMDVEKSVNEAAILLGLDGVKLVNECKGLTVLADSLLRQLFYNLIDNTLWHGQMVTQIKVHCKEEKDCLKLVYEDNGVGVPENEKELIFKEGYGKSTGYGLYLIRNICKAYGWSIKETGEPGKGAQFTMTIPKREKDGKPSYKLN